MYAFSYQKSTKGGIYFGRGEGDKYDVLTKKSIIFWTFSFDNFINPT
jgi:hypothetical protein